MALDQAGLNVRDRRPEEDEERHHRVLNGTVLTLPTIAMSVSTISRRAAVDLAELRKSDKLVTRQEAVAAEAPSRLHCPPAGPLRGSLLIFRLFRAAIVVLALR